MATQLTDRQKEINDLLQKGKTPGEIAKKLKISENGVYQHMRRIRAATGAKPKAASRSRSRASGSNSRSRSRASGSRTTAKRTTKRAPARRPAPVAPTPVPATPLAAIRARRDEITATLDEVRTAEKRLTDELAKATAAREKAEGSVAEELTRLAQSEAILTGKALPRAADKSRARSGSKPAAKATPNGKAAEATPPAADGAARGEAEAQAQVNGSAGAATPPAVAATPERAEAEAAQAAAEASDEPTPVGALIGEERPGVETVPEFAQEDGFEGEAS